MIDTARQLLAAEAEVREIAEQLDEAKARRDALNGQLVQQMTDEEVQSLNVSGKLLYLDRTVQASYDKSVEDKFFEALEGHGYGAIIKPTVNSRTLTASVRELIEANGDELPDWLDGMVKVFYQPKVKIRKA